jgi:tetratricopeptide (TPR) repeat protein
MRYLRLIWTLVSATFGNQAAAQRLRHGMSALNAIDAVMTPYRKGDYQSALDAAEGFRQDGEVSASYCFYRGSCLAHLGRLPEAETWLQRNIAMRQTNETRYLSIGYTTLGHLLLQSARYNEAVECFATSIRLAPERSSGYRSMAEVILLSGGEPDDAVRWARQSVEKGKVDKIISPELRKLTMGENLATLAWAIAAASHDAPEVERLVTEAVAIVGTRTLSSTVQVQCHCGRAFAELGDGARSAHHFEETVRLDQQGEWGRAARTAVSGGLAKAGELPAAR